MTLALAKSTLQQSFDHPLREFHQSRVNFLKFHQSVEIFPTVINFSAKWTFSTSFFFFCRAVKRRIYAIMKNVTNITQHPIARRPFPRMLMQKLFHGSPILYLYLSASYTSTYRPPIPIYRPL